MIILAGTPGALCKKSNNYVPHPNIRDHGINFNTQNKRRFILLMKNMAINGTFTHKDNDVDWTGPWKTNDEGMKEALQREQYRTVYFEKILQESLLSMLK